MKFVRRELQPIVMCGGRGTRLPTLPNVPPKCLLPIGPYPLIWYTLSMLEREHFQDAIVIVLDNEKSEINSAVDKLNLKLKIEYLTIPADKDMGTAESLKHIYDKIDTDVLVLSCDLITDVELSQAIELFRKHNASAVSIMFDNGSPEFILVPGPTTKVKPERDIVGIDKETQRLVFLASASDFDETVTLPAVLLRKHPLLSMHSKLLDSHIYLLRKWVIDFMKEEKPFTTVKGELLPYIVKKQLSKPSKNPRGASDDNPIFKYAVESDLDKKISQTSSFNDHSRGIKSCYHNDIVRCYAHIPYTSTYGIRVNTLSAYWLINNKIIKMWEKLTKGRALIKIHPSSDVKSKQVDESSIVGENSIINEKTSIRNTIIGSNCVVENKVTLNNCILMNNVKVLEGSILQDCIIYPKATISNNCKFTLCIIGPGFTVPANEKAEQIIIPEISENMIVL